MAYDICLLSNHSITEKLYFFDANLWIKILRPPFNPDSRDQKYLSFFQKFKTHTNHPRIAVTALVLSEVINRLLREYAKSYFKKQNKGVVMPSSYYKDTFRNSEEFAIQYELICDDIKSYHTLYELLGDELGTIIKTKHLLSTPPKGLDFNDHYYYLLTKHKSIPIVTDDSDFFVEGVSVLTFNDKLYQSVKNSIIPKSK